LIPFFYPFKGRWYLNIVISRIMEDKMNFQGTKHILWEAMAPGVRERALDEIARRAERVRETREIGHLETQPSAYLQKCVAYYENGKIGNLACRLLGFAPSREEIERRYRISKDLLKERAKEEGN
jgi:hypothetical protein